MRAEIRYLARETKKKQTTLAQRNSLLEESVSSERSKKRDTGMIEKFIEKTTVPTHTREECGTELEITNVLFYGQNDQNDL